MDAQLVLVLSVGVVGVLHTIVPDHWVPITLIARQYGWSRAETARAAFIAGTGHVVSTLLIGLIVWAAGAAVAKSFGTIVSQLSSVALIVFGGWIAVTSWRELGQRADEHQHVPDAAQKTSSRTALLLILGSSPMVEGIPAFFAAGKYGIGLLVTMAIVFAISTIATYVALCVFSTTSLQQVEFGRFERYGEVLSGAFIAVVGIIFLIFPIL
ncbi:MAG TPA: hypothetical protein VKG44_05485 [Candidatus Baltobacteraceae bacterium]|nr:hypothetical protein [Candidatus Baltobacteraceae bacterium]